MRPLVPLLLAMPIVACGGDGRGPQADEGLNQLRKREAARVRTTPIVQREMVRTISTTTTLESENEIEIFPRVSGIVEEVLAEEGDRVAAGEVLAVLDDREAQAALDDAEVALQEANDAEGRLELAVREAFERAQSSKLAWEQSIREVERNEKAALLSEVELDKLRLSRDTNERNYEGAKLGHEGAQSDLENQATTIARAQLAVEKEQLDLSYTRITAHFDGVIAQRAVKVGDTAASARAAFTLTDPDNLRAVVYRPQRELPFFQAARHPEASAGIADEIEIRIYADALPGEEYHGLIRFLSPTIDPDSGSFRLTIGLEQPRAGSNRPRLLPGMLVRLEIVTERHPDALVVPKRAVRREGEKHSVFVVREGRVAQIEVREGFSDNEFMEVHPADEDALRLGELVVVVGNRDLEDGSEVRAETWQDEAAPEVVDDLEVAGSDDSDGEESPDADAETTGSEDAEAEDTEDAETSSGGAP